jgi:phospholipid/cholesterol/gamma-HCH transport system substrate-binding protein
METRANYALIGVFTLAVIAAAFMFVLWFSGADKPSGRKTYQVVFNGSISGLSRGAWVLFNGLRVGEVTKMDLMPDPSQVYALIDVDGRVPVKVDTKARLEYQGFTGVASVALEGGSPTAEPLQGAKENPPVIYADRSDFQNLVDSAQRLSAKLDTILGQTTVILDENRQPVARMIRNAEKFSDALATNSDGLKDLIATLSDVGKSARPLFARLEDLTKTADGLVKSVDQGEVRKIVESTAALTAKLDKAATQLEPVLTSLNGALKSGDTKGMFNEIADAAKSIRKLAENLDVRTREMAVNINRFTGPGMRQYEALAAEGRKTIEEVGRAVRSLEKNPQQLIFGGKPSIPEYSGR